MKKLLILLLLGFYSTGAFAQMNKVLTASTYLTRYFQDNKNVDELISARDALEGTKDHDKSKNNAKTYLYWGKVYYELSMQEDKALSDGALKTAFDAFQKCGELDSKGKYKQEVGTSLALMTNAFYNQGSQAYQAKDYATAYSNFRQVLDINDINNKKAKVASVDTTTMLAAAYSAHKGGMVDEAVGLYNALVEMKYEDAAVYQSLASLYREKGETEKANETLQVGRELFPDSKALVIDELNILLKEGKQDEAIAKMEEAVKLDPENETLYFALGAAYDSQKKYDQAQTAYQSALDLNPEYFDPYYNLGAIFYNQAAEKTKEMNELDLNDQTNYDRLKKESDDLFVKALPFFEKALNLKEDQSTLIALKEIYARQGNNDKYKEMDDKIKAFGK